MNAVAQIRRSCTLAQMLDDVADAARMPLNGRDLHIARALQPYLGDPALLAGQECAPGAECYTRHLLHQDDAAGYAVVAIVWTPGQMSPVHGHRTWCGLGVHTGCLTETFYRAEHGVARPFGGVVRLPGDVSHASADPHAIHRLANTGDGQAISVHAYGVRFDSFGGGVNHIWASERSEPDTWSPISQVDRPTKQA